MKSKQEKNLVSVRVTGMKRSSAVVIDTIRKHFPVQDDSGLIKNRSAYGRQLYRQYIKIEVPDQEEKGQE